MRLAGLIVVALVSVASCSTGTEKPADAGNSKPAAAPASKEPNKKIVIGFSQANNGDEWRVNQTKKVEETCKALMPGAEVIVTDAQGKDDKQASDVADLVNRKVDVLLLTANTADALTPAVEKAMAAGIPVITLDRGVETAVTQHIGADNKLIGETAAKFVAEEVLGGKGGKVIEVQGTLGASATIDRNKEFVNYLKANHPNVQIIASQTAEYRRDKALKFMNDMLQKYKKGDYDVVYAHNDAMALGVIQAMKTAGRLDEAKVVGIDGQNEAIDAIKDGSIAATFTYDNAGKEGCESAKKLIDGQKIDEKWVLPTNQIDGKNAAEWVGKGF